LAWLFALVAVIIVVGTVLAALAAAFSPPLPARPPPPSAQSTSRVHQRPGRAGRRDRIAGSGHMSGRGTLKLAAAAGAAVPVNRAGEVSETDAAVFQTVRPRLFGIAYRVLGSASEADDVVQETWIRWQGTDRSTVRDAAAFLAPARQPTGSSMAATRSGLRRAGPPAPSAWADAYEPSKIRVRASVS
jgi:RNA polymerase sigma-70 factor (ECF subfamily)